MRTKITLGTSGTIELFEDIPISLTFSIADIKKPDTRQGSFSKTITIPGSKNNDILFAHSYEIGIDGRFNPNIRTPCVIEVDGIEQISGFLRLMKIKRTDENKIEYECSIIGNVSNVFTVWGDAELTALSLAEYDHTYNKANQKASWTASVGSGYVYPMIDYGFTNGLTYDVENFYPAVYLKTYIDKIFDYAGFTYTSNFFGSDLFKRLIIPLNSNVLRLSDADINARLFAAAMSTSGSVSLSGLAAGASTSPFTTIVPFDAEALDPSNQFNTSTYTFTAANIGSYNFDSTIRYQLNSAAASAPTGWVVVFKYSGGTYTMISTTAFPAIDNTLRSVSINASGVELLAGDQVFIGLQIVASAPGTPNLNLATGTFVNSVNNVGLFEGNTVSMTASIPQKVKMKELFMSIVKMFNLYIETDKDYANKLYIEPRNDFYALGVTKDWTKKWDISQALEITPMGDLDARKYLFTYTDDKDYYNELYRKTWNETYGTKTVDVDNEFITGNKENKVIFSPTPLVNNGSTDRTIPAIFSTDSAGNITPKQSNIRILYYAGTKATTYPWTYTGDVSGTSSETTYPYAGHLDSVSAPTIDLSFGVPFEVYYSATSYTNNNLYNAYYRQFIEEITDKDSKMVTGYFYLTPEDILTLDFRNEFYVDGHFLRLNKIFDFNPVKTGLTKCEFVKIKSANPFVPQEKDVVGGASSEFDNGDVIPLGGTIGKPKNLTVGSVKSPGNFTGESVDGVIVTGYRNHIGEGCSNVSMLNCSGCVVMPGLHGVTIFNSSGVTVTENDVVYVNGAKLANGTTKTYKANLTQTGTNVPAQSYVFQNDLLVSSTGYAVTGVYTLNFPANTFPDASKVFFKLGSLTNTANANWQAVRTTATRITIYTNVGAVATDGLLNNSSIEITVLQ